MATTTAPTPSQPLPGTDASKGIKKRKPGIKEQQLKQLLVLKIELELTVLNHMLVKLAMNQIIPDAKPNLAATKICGQRFRLKIVY
ncbi:hypothetical protein TNCV_2511061 [Trichonephila clavipes]|nr:hypothetical protein TNCV_2511061 [Trichonephila clavipes]